MTSVQRLVSFRDPVSPRLHAGRSRKVRLRLQQGRHPVRHADAALSVEGKDRLEPAPDPIRDDPPQAMACAHQAGLDRAERQRQVAGDVVQAQPRGFVHQKHQPQIRRKALVVAPLVREHGVEYLFAAGLLAGLFQILFGFARLATLMRYVSNSVRTGFVNAVAILIFAAQLPHILNAGPNGYAVIATGLAVIYLAPRLTTRIPAPLICVVLLTALCSGFGIDVPRVADLGALPDGLPAFHIPDVPWALISSASSSSRRSPSRLSVFWRA